MIFFVSLILAINEEGSRLKAVCIEDLSLEINEGTKFGAGKLIVSLISAITKRGSRLGALGNVDLSGQ